MFAITETPLTERLEDRLSMVLKCQKDIISSRLIIPPIPLSPQKPVSTIQFQPYLPLKPPLKIIEDSRHRGPTTGGTPIPAGIQALASTRPINNQTNLTLSAPPSISMVNFGSQINPALQASQTVNRWGVYPGGSMPQIVGFAIPPPKPTTSKKAAKGESPAQEKAGRVSPNLNLVAVVVVLALVVAVVK